MQQQHSAANPAAPDEFRVVDGPRGLIIRLVVHVLASITFMTTTSTHMRDVKFHHGRWVCFFSQTADFRIRNPV